MTSIIEATLQHPICERFSSVSGRIFPRKKVSVNHCFILKKLSFLLFLAETYRSVWYVARRWPYLFFCLYTGSYPCGYSLSTFLILFTRYMANRSLFAILPSTLPYPQSVRFRHVLTTLYSLATKRLSWNLNLR